jgi:spoIIIJ-associated protein
MIRIEAQTLQEAFSQAAAELSCSVTEIDIQIIQNPSMGFLGFFKKTAIIEAQRSSSSSSKKHARKEKEVKEEVKEEKKRPRRNRKPKQKRQEATHKEQHTKVEVKKDEKKVNTTSMFDEEFHKPKVDIKEAVNEIKKNINQLFVFGCFELDAIKVEPYDDTTVLIEFSGEDSALLIGKEGYRYKALSYLLYNWINLKYNFNIRLEIAEFLKNQEEMIGKYLVSVIERVNNNGRAQTKILDGVLVKIALEALREEFPHKYVGIKTSREGGKFIVINDFNRKNS